jgi:hypothetical protein
MPRRAISNHLFLSSLSAGLVSCGRFGDIPEGIEASLKGVSARGTGVTAKIMAWCEGETEPFV